MVRLDAQQDIDIGQTLRAEITRFFPAPEHAAEVAVEADRQALFLSDAQHIQHQLAAIRAERRGDAAQVEPVKALQQRAQIDIRKIILRHGAVLSVIDDLARADSVSGFKVIGAQTVSRRFFRCGKNHRRAVNVVGTQPADGAFAQTVIRNDREERAVYAEVGERERDIGFAAAVACLKSGCHANLFVVWRRQTEHDFAHGDKLFAVFHVLEQGIVMNHKCTCLPDRQAV